MRVLVADDDSVTRLMLEELLTEWGYFVISVSEGIEALQILESESAPRLAVLDWVMPGIDGVELCRRVRQSKSSDLTYLILLTVKGSKQDIIEGFEAGANDYVQKPFDHEELRARVQVGRRLVELQLELAARVKELQEALAQIKTLSGLLPICCVCKKIRDDKGYWQQIEAYLRDRSDARFTHSYCPECARKLYPHIYDK